MPPLKHAILGASSAKRWLICPGSVEATKGLPDTSSEFAEEGSLCHELGEIKVKQSRKLGVGKATFTKKHEEIKNHPMYKVEMEAYSDAYMQYIDEIYMSFKSQPFIAVELTVDYSDIAPEGFGTADCVILGDDTLHVIDYKHGKGVPVSPYENEQFMLYAYGVLRLYSVLYDIKKVVLHCFQPRIDNIDTWDTTPKYITEWANTYVKPRAEVAFNGSDVFCAGEHCQFCKIRATCKTRADAFVAYTPWAEANKQPMDFTDEELAALVGKVNLMKQWANHVIQHIEQQLLAGKEIKGCKLVSSRQMRSFTDIQGALEKAKELGIEEALLYDRTPISLTGIEGLVGKAKFKKEFADFIQLDPCKPTLVVDSDPRDKYNRAEEAFNEPLPTIPQQEKENTHA